VNYNVCNGILNDNEEWLLLNASGPMKLLLLWNDRRRNWPILKILLILMLIFRPILMRPARQYNIEDMKMTIIGQWPIQWPVLIIVIINDSIDQWNDWPRQTEKPTRPTPMTYWMTCGIMTYYSEQTEN